MVRIVLLSALALLAACATPQDRCRREATEDLRVINALIAETEATIARGYAVETETRVSPSLTFCTGYQRRIGVSFCTSDRVVQRDRPVAVDLDEERAKLASLRQKRVELEARARRELAVCDRAG